MSVSAVQRKSAVLLALLVLVIAGAGLILMSLGEYTYRDVGSRAFATASPYLAEAAG